MHACTDTQTDSVLLQGSMLYVHTVHNKAGMFDVMLDTPVDIADCRTIRVNITDATM